MKLVVATNNKGKLKEFKYILKDKELLTLEDIGFLDDIEETGNTFHENSLIKAETVSNYLKSKSLDYDVIADDSGLCCPSLNGEPGIYSARYSGGHGNNSENRRLLISKLVDKDKYGYFVCVLTLYHIDGTSIQVEGRTEGTIIDVEKGDTSFGYDCIFLSKDLNKTFGEATEEEKNGVSHRSRALVKIKEYL